MTLSIFTKFVNKPLVERVYLLGFGAGGRFLILGRSGGVGGLSGAGVGVTGLQLAKSSIELIHQNEKWDKSGLSNGVW